MNKVALVVDDTSYIREDIKDILEEQGYKVFEAGDGLEAVEMYKKVNPAIVTMDINMPRMHGLKATQVITDFDKDAKIMICSTMVMFPNYMKMGKEAGAKAFLSKPFDEDEFMNIEYYTPEEVEKMIDNNEIVDSKTIACFFKARKYMLGK